MKENPLVTILMPVYNGGEYLLSSIESILKQTYRDFEFLIINDCSTDNSMEIVRSFNDARIVMHSNSLNMGQTKSLNVGLRIAKGRYIVVNDADDLSLPQRIEKQLHFIIKHPEYAVIGTSAFIMDRSGRLKRTFHKPVDPSEISLWILSDTPIIHGSVIMNKEIILANGGYNEEFRICQDYELWSSLMRKGFRVANMPDILVVIRYYLDSISFKEKDAQTIENGRIMHANVSALTSLKISHDEAVRQRLFFAATDQLSTEDFIKAEELFIQEYKRINSSLMLDSDIILNNLKKKLLTPYAKQALRFFKHGNLKEAREISRRYLNIYGWSLILFIIWAASFSNMRLLGRFLSLHSVLQRLEAYYRLYSGKVFSSHHYKIMGRP